MLRKTIMSLLTSIGLMTVDLVLLAVTFFNLYVYRITKELNIPFDWTKAFDLSYLSGLPSFDFYYKLYGFLTVVTIGFLVSYQGYVWNRKVPLIEQGTKVFRAVTYAVLLGMGTTFIFKIPFFSRFVFFTFWLSAIILLWAWRGVLGLIIGGMIKRGYFTRKLLIVGAGQIGQRVCHELIANPHLGFRLVGLVDDDPRKIGKEFSRVEVIGDTSLVEKLAKEAKVDEILITIPSERELIKRLIGQNRRYNVQIRIVPEMSDLVTGGVEVGQMGMVPYMRIVKTPMQGWPLLIKRLIDIVGATVGLVCLSPLFLILAIAIKLDSKGPLIFAQKRVGKNGRIFDFYKFRSMVVNAEELKEKLATVNEADGPVFKMKDDPRVTRVGKFIRKYSIDELPQLYNVLNGDMSLVGPRPPLPKEVEKYGDWEWRRLEVTPGLTCIWQVSGRSNISFDKWMELDVYYIENWSLWMDLKILLETIPAVFRGSGAY